MKFLLHNKRLKSPFGDPKKALFVRLPSTVSSWYEHTKMSSHIYQNGYHRTQEWSLAMKIYNLEIANSEDVNGLFHLTKLSQIPCKTNETNSALGRWGYDISEWKTWNKTLSYEVKEKNDKDRLKNWSSPDRILHMWCEYTKELEEKERKHCLLERFVVNHGNWHEISLHFHSSASVAIINTVP